MKTEHLLMTIIGISLSISGWLLTEKVSQINDTLKEIQSTTGNVKENIATLRAQVDRNTLDILSISRRK